MSESIEHPGIVEQVDGSKVRVRITQYSACAGCHAKDKWIDVEDASGDYHTGEAVVIVGENSLGREAVLLAFVLPVVIVLGAIIGGSAAGWAETVSGAFGLLVLVPYYIILYVLRDKLKKHFVFRLKKLKDQ